VGDYLLAQPATELSVFYELPKSALAASLSHGSREAHPTNGLLLMVRARRELEPAIASRYFFDARFMSVLFRRPTA
jgi:hypothetical protein